MANKETVKLIDRAYTALGVLNDKHPLPYRDMIYDLAAAGERQHRRFNTGPYQCSVATAAKHHVLKWVVKYSANPEELPSVKDLLTIRNDVQLAAMVVANYRDVILKALQGFDLQKLQGIDYVALVENRAD